MPIYEYQCQRCGVFEHRQSINDDPLRRCPTCRAGVQKLLSASAFHLKGGGWYADGYGSKAGSAEKKSSADGAAVSNAGAESAVGSSNESGNSAKPSKSGGAGKSGTSGKPAKSSGASPKPAGSDG